jgi:Zn-dependent M16 (insulinase) family peptidase
MRRAGRGITSEAALSHRLGGSGALAILNSQLENYEQQAETIISNIEEIRNFLRDPSRWTISFTGSDSVYQKLEERVRQWSTAMTNPPVAADPLPFTQIAPPHEGLAAPIKVAHCAKVMPAPTFSDPVTPLYELGLYLANFDYLLPQIRFKGNAYGAGSQYNAQQGTLALYSFNDPHITETLEVFDGLRDFIHNADWSQTDVDRAIIGSAKKIVQPIRPAEATLIALVRHIRGESDAMRAEKYRATHSATPQAIKRALLEQLEKAEPLAGICVAASQEHLQQANKTLKQNPLIISDVLG